MATKNANNVGSIVQVIGPVVDVEFTGDAEMPPLLAALEVNFEVEGKKTRVVLEVQQHLGDDWARAVAMSSTEGLKRGMPVTNTGGPITVPVGEGVLGRVLNVLGEPVDERGPITWTIDPTLFAVLVAITALLFPSGHGHLCRGNLQQFGRNAALSDFVIFQG